MSVVVLLSAKGAPGVTTTAVALTRAWPGVTGRSALLVEADPTGGDVVAGLLRGSLDVPMGILALATLREPTLAGVWGCAVGIPSDDQSTSGSCGLLPGVPDQARAAALELAWDSLRSVESELDESGCDLLVDAGRVNPGGLRRPWLAGADLAVLVLSTGLPQVLAARRIAGQWPDQGPQLGVLIREDRCAGSYSGAEVATAIERPLLGVLVDDDEAASVNSHGAAPGRRYRRSTYRRAVGEVARAMREQAQHQRDALRGAQ